MENLWKELGGVPPDEGNQELNTNTTSQKLLSLRKCTPMEEKVYGIIRPTIYDGLNNKDGVVVYTVPFFLWQTKGLNFSFYT